MKRAFVIGHPINHSRSPLIHGHWIKVHGIDGSYEAIDVATADLPAFFARVTAGEFAGAMSPSRTRRRHSPSPMNSIRWRRRSVR